MLRAGTLNCGVRCITVRCAAVSAITGTAWMPVDPVPIWITRLPVKSTPSCGHAPVWYHSPANDSRPSNFGTLVVERQPTAVIRYFALKRSPASVVTSQRLRDSS